MMSILHAPSLPRVSSITLVLALVGLVSSGCERSPAGTVPDDSAAEVAQGADSGCETIEDCDSYLSCIDSTCQEPPAVTGNRDSDTPSVQFVDSSGEEVASFFIELAVTSSEQRQGLMYRREMKDDWGMLFIYPDEGIRSFWMENTFISLDMIFIDGQGRIVNIIEEVEPLTRTRRTSKGPARYVLELEAGRAAQAGLEPGQRMQLENVAEEHLPTP